MDAAAVAPGGHAAAQPGLLRARTAAGGPDRLPVSVIASCRAGTAPGVRGDAPCPGGRACSGRVPGRHGAGRAPGSPRYSSPRVSRPVAGRSRHSRSPVSTSGTRVSAATAARSCQAARSVEPPTSKESAPPVIRTA